MEESRNPSFYLQESVLEESRYSFLDLPPPGAGGLLSQVDLETTTETLIDLPSSSSQIESVKPGEILQLRKETDIYTELLKRRGIYRNHHSLSGIYTQLNDENLLGQTSKSFSEIERARADARSSQGRDSRGPLNRSSLILDDRNARPSSIGLHPSLDKYRDSAQDPQRGPDDQVQIRNTATRQTPMNSSIAQSTIGPFQRLPLDISSIASSAKLSDYQESRLTEFRNQLLDDSFFTTDSILSSRREPKTTVAHNTSRDAHKSRHGKEQSHSNPGAGNPERNKKASNSKKEKSKSRDKVRTRGEGSENRRKDEEYRRSPLRDPSNQRDGKDSAPTQDATQRANQRKAGEKRSNQTRASPQRTNQRQRSPGKANQHEDNPGNALPGSNNRREPSLSRNTVLEPSSLRDKDPTAEYQILPHYSDLLQRLSRLRDSEIGAPRVDSDGKKNQLNTVATNTENAGASTSAAGQDKDVQTDSPVKKSGEKADVGVRKKRDEPYSPARGKSQKKQKASSMMVDGRPPPFIAGKSTAPSFSVGVNLQQLLGTLKAQNPQLLHAYVKAGSSASSVDIGNLFHTELLKMIRKLENEVDKYLKKYDEITETLEAEGAEGTEEREQLAEAQLEVAKSAEWSHAALTRAMQQYKQLGSALDEQSKSEARGGRACKARMRRLPHNRSSFLGSSSQSHHQHASFRNHIMDPTVSSLGRAASSPTLSRFRKESESEDRSGPEKLRKIRSLRAALSDLP